MNIIKLIIGVTILFLFSSCSSEEEKCNDSLNPTTNEFTINCERYPTPEGRLLIDRSREFEISKCNLLFINDEFNNGLNYTLESDKINVVDIVLIFSSDFEPVQEIPEGIYVLDKDLNDGLKPFDIQASNRVILGSRVEGSLYTDWDDFYGTSFDEIIVNIEKNGDIYSIDYSMEYEGLTIKGKYSGVLDVKFKRP